MEKTRFACQITLPNSKYYYTGIGSVNKEVAVEEGMEVKTVNYSGNCNYSDINKLAHKGVFILIDGISVADFIDKIATEEEIKDFFNFG